MATESKRVKKFRLSLARQIPKFPNDRPTLNALEAKSLSSLLIDYINWTIRLVKPRPRHISIEPEALADCRWNALSNEIDSFLSKVKSGEDLTPHLSLEAQTRGYTQATSIKVPNVNKWEDKDFLLNVMGYHHFHLGLTIEKKGFVTRTNEVLFASVTRDQFNVVSLFDHSVFEMSRNPSTAMNAERERLWKMFEKHRMRGVSPGSVVIPSMIMTSGHSMQCVRLADYYAHVIREIDAKIDDPLYVQEFYSLAVNPLPDKFKPRWHMDFLDLGLLDENLGIFFVLCYGPN